MVTKQLKAAGIKVIIEPHKNLPENFDRVGSRFDNAAILNAAGVELAISSGSSYLLPQHAGNAVSYGLPWEAAFAAISSVPAGWFGIDTGTLQKDTPATLVVWNGDPLEVTSAPIFIMIDGKVQSLTSRQTELRDRYHPLSEEKMPYKYR
jgi:imidazolonepropionase-like amidohydrolase